MHSLTYHNGRLDHGSVAAVLDGAAARNDGKRLRNIYDFYCLAQRPNPWSMAHVVDTAFRHKSVEAIVALAEKIPLRKNGGYLGRAMDREREHEEFFTTLLERLKPTPAQLGEALVYATKQGRANVVEALQERITSRQKALLRHPKRHEVTLQHLNTCQEIALRHAASHGNKTVLYRLLGNTFFATSVVRKAKWRALRRCNIKCFAALRRYAKSIKKFYAKNLDEVLPSTFPADLTQEIASYLIPKKGPTTNEVNR